MAGEKVSSLKAIDRLALEQEVQKVSAWRLVRTTPILTST